MSTERELIRELRRCLIDSDEYAESIYRWIIAKADAYLASSDDYHATPEEVCCEDCNAPYGADGWCDVVIPDPIWNSLGVNLLCFRCMTKRLEARGYDCINPVPVIIVSGPYKDANEEWRLIGWEHGHKVGREESALAQPPNCS